LVNYLKKGVIMERLLKLVLAGAIAFAVTTTVASADAGKGQKLYSKKLLKACGINGAKMAAKHTQDQWEDIGVDGLADELKGQCPKVKAKALKSKYLKHYYDFFYNFASDSGNVPSC
jgi:hypothetical protein